MREDCVASLVDEQTETRIREVHEANKKTFQWLFDPSIVSFSSWLRDRSLGASSIYWIQGKPGSGKSTLMKFAMHDQKLWEVLETKQCTVAAYFFHDRGSAIQKTLIGMFQQILGSVLTQVPALTPYVVPVYRRIAEAQKTKTPAWSFDALKSTMLAIMKQREVRLDLLLFLDALDEHDGDDEVLASLLNQLADMADGDCVRLKICLASRSWTVFQRHFGQCPGLAIHNHTHLDIRTYIETRSHFDPRRLGPFDDRINLLRIIDLVANKAHGVFIWVKLVMDLLSKGIRDGTPYRLLEDQISKMPPELEDLYAATLRRVEPQYSEEAYIMLQITLKSLEPIPLETFMTISNLNLNQPHSGWAVEDRVALNENRLESRGGGLLEISMIGPESSKPVVQFIHQTVKEFVQSSQHRLGLVAVPSKLLSEDGNLFLLRSFTRYDGPLSHLQRDIFVYAARATIRSPFNKNESFGNARTNEVVSVVSDVMLSQTDSDLEWFVNQHSGTFFDHLKILVEESDWRNALMLLAIAAGFPALVRKSSEICPGILHVAVAGPFYDIDHETTIRCLVAKGCPINEVYHCRNLRDSMDDTNLFSYHFTALTLAILLKDIDESTRQRIVSVLLELGAEPSIAVKTITPLTDFSRGNFNLIELSVLRSSATVVRLLLERIVCDGIPSGLAWQLHRAALIRGDKDIVQLLFDFGLCNRISSYLIERYPIHDMLMYSSLCIIAPVGRPAYPLHPPLMSIMGNPELSSQRDIN